MKLENARGGLTRVQTHSRSLHRPGVEVCPSDEDGVTPLPSRLVRTDIHTPLTFRPKQDITSAALHPEPWITR